LCVPSLAQSVAKVNRNPISPRASLEFSAKAKDYYDRNKLAECISNSDTSISLDPQNSSGYILSGLAYKRLERYEQAIPLLVKHLQLFRNEPHWQDQKWETQTYADLSECYWAVGNTRKAIESLSNGLGLDPKSDVCLSRRAELYCQTKQFKAALADADALILLAPRFYRNFLLRGRIDMNAGDYKTAVGDFSKAIRFQSDMADTYALRARAYEKLGQTDLALADKQRSRQLARQLEDP